MDEALGQPFQASLIDVINSFFKEPIVQADQMQQEEATETDADADADANEEMEEQEQENVSEHDEQGPHTATH